MVDVDCGMGESPRVHLPAPRLTLLTVCSKAPSKMRDVVVGTAGHIDHGKTLLVKAITGMDADRWEEEKRRGITLDIGFATLRDPRGTLHFVDLPGHERFIKNMLAGATGVDLCLLVVAADESVMPQTVEHTEILELLGVRRGVVALNKVDLVDAETREMALLELAEFLGAHGLGHLPVVPVSAAKGEGVEDLLNELYGQAEACPPPPSDRPFRLPVDRVFPVKGFGTVVTGTCIDGELGLGDQVEVFPGMGVSRVRGLQVFGRGVDRVRAGQRVAVNIPDLKHQDLRRGHLAAVPGSLWPTHLLDVNLSLLPSARHPIRTGTICTLHLHTQEVEAHVHLERGSELGPGETSLAQLRLPAPVMAWPGDRFILRLPSPARTVGGGKVILPAKRKARWRRPIDQRTALALKEATPLEAVVSEAGPVGVTGAEASARLGRMAAALEPEVARAEGEKRIVRWGGGAWWLEPSEARAWQERASAWLRSRHEGRTPLTSLPRQEFLGRWQRLLEPSRAEALLEAMVREGILETEGDRVKPAGHRVQLSEAQAKAADELRAALGVEDFTVRTGKELEEVLGPAVRQVLPLLTASGDPVRFGGDFFLSAGHLARLKSLLAERAAKVGPVITVPEFKEMLGITRKYAMPLLEYLDDLKWTRREGDGRRILCG
jgi:selenocysteine-specific elongation factor